MLKIHIDTDLGGDIDDLCALGLVLCWPEEVQITGVTVVGDTDGRRAGYVRYVLDMENRPDVPVAAGAVNSPQHYRYDLGLPPESRYWPQPVKPLPGDPDQAVELLKSSIEQGARVLGIGPLTNFALLETKYPGILARADLFLMGGYVYPPRPGYPEWKNEDDFNVQIDAQSSLHGLRNACPTLITLASTAETALRQRDLEALRKSGRLGRLIARQAEAFSVDENMQSKYGKVCENIPEDIINFQHDALAAAVALGYRDGIEIDQVPLVIEENEGWVRERVDDAGRVFRVVTKVEGERFNAFWLERVARTNGNDLSNTILI